jgi:hypothetical protein
MHEIQEGHVKDGRRYRIPPGISLLSAAILLIFGSSCGLLPAPTNDDLVKTTLASLSTHIAAQATELAHQEEMIEYLATRGPAVATLVPVGAAPTPYRPVVGSVKIEGGRCCMVGTVGEPMEFSVAFEAMSLVGHPVSEMRIRLSNKAANEDELVDADWKPFSPQQVFTVITPANWVAFTLSVQFSDQAGNLSPVYSDEIIVEGSPSEALEGSQGWKTYRNLAGGFSLQIPSDLGVLEKSGILGGFIGKRIEFNILDQSPYWVQCQTDGIGDCPVMEDIEQVVVGTTQATRISGYIGAIGGKIPQEYVTYVIEDKSRYLIFTVWGVDFDARLSSAGTRWLLSADAVEGFDSMMQSLRLDS